MTLHLIFAACSPVPRCSQVDLTRLPSLSPWKRDYTLEHVLVSIWRYVIWRFFRIVLGNAYG